MFDRRKAAGSFIGRIAITLGLATVAFSAFAQAPDKTFLVKLDACNRKLTVSQDGRVVETRHAVTTEWNLSRGELKKLHRVIAHAPCLERWKKWQQASNSSAEVPANKSLEIKEPASNDCLMEWLSAGIGLDEVQVTLNDADNKAGPFPVYIVCDHAKKEYKSSAGEIYQRNLKPAWQRFLVDLSKAIGGKSILEGCDCWQD
ncbi:MAG TPA: hypothetical protein VLL54_01505 [Pyrinomonadaceae bacterium]|nr:hypothetical protein [Pyrinomonadaceae bacterium]